MRMCEIAACNGRVFGFDLCNKHYKKFKRYGDPLGGKSRAANGSGCQIKGGYFIRTERGEVRMEHIRIAEKALGKRLPRGAVVHHVDENPGNNEPSNLVICPSPGYHMLLHQRQRAMDACGNPNWRLCYLCGKYDAPENLYLKRNQAWHRVCRNANARANYLKERT